MEEIIIYTDGACKNNPGPGGYAAIIFDKDQKKGIKGGAYNTTNNIMELTAVLEALKWVLSSSLLFKENNNVHVKVHSDSNYVVNAINNNWIKTWEEKGWKNSGGDVKNKELWEEMLYLLDKFNQITFIKVKGHSTDKYNNLCDKYASEEAEKFKEKKEAEETKEYIEKEERQSDTIASLVIENSKLKNKIRLLEEEINNLKK